MMRAAIVNPKSADGIEADGELAGGTDATFELLPSALAAIGMRQPLRSRHSLL